MYYCNDLSFYFESKYEKEYFMKNVNSFGVGLCDLVSEDERLDQNCKYYCPRCKSQFVSEISICPDCPGVKVVKY